MARRICDMAAPKGVTLMIEPVNRYEINFVNSVDDAAALLARVERDNVGIMPDLFHMNIEEPSIAESLRRAGPRIYHVHLADSNRWYPGAGHIDFGQVVRTLEAIGYIGGQKAARPRFSTFSRSG